MIVVTAPTSMIGRQVLAKVLDSGRPIRVVARDPSRLPPPARDRAEIIVGSHSDPDIVDRAFDGADALFWLVPPDPRAASIDAAYSGFAKPACATFARGGVKRVVGISALGRGTPFAGKAGYVTASLAMDDLIASTGVGYRALLMPSFMDNILRQVPLIKEWGMFTSTISPSMALPSCATRDIAAAAAKLLLDDTWSGQGSVAVLGPEDLTHDGMAGIMTEVLGLPVRFQQITSEAFKARLISFGMSEAMAERMVDMYTAKDAGLDNAEPRTPQSSSPTSFRQWCQEVLKPAVQA